MRGEKYCLPTLYSIFKNNLPFHKPFNQNNLYHGYVNIYKKVRINKRSLCKCSEVRLESLATFYDVTFFLRTTTNGKETGPGLGHTYM